MSASPRRLPIIEIELGGGDKAYVNFDNTVGIAIEGSINERTGTLGQSVHPNVIIVVTARNGQQETYLSSESLADITLSVSDQIARL